MKPHTKWIGGTALIAILAILVFLHGTCIWEERSGGEQHPYNPSDMPASLTCREVTGPLPTWRNWGRSWTRSAILRNGLVSDEDRLWIATNQGVIRLNLRTWQCDLFRSAAGRSLAGAFPLLPDGQGGLWVGVKGEVLRFTDDQWMLAYLIPPDHPRDVFTLGYGRTGSLCLELRGVGWRSVPWVERTCLAGHRFPLQNTPFTGPYRYGDSLFTGCGLWKRAYSAHLSYATPEMCMWLQAILYPEQWRRIATVSPERGEAWMAERSQSGVELYHWSNNFAVSSKIPYQDVHALAVDPVYGGVWMTTESGLLHVEWNGARQTPGKGAVSILPRPTMGTDLSPLATPPARFSATTFTFHPLNLGIGNYPDYSYVSGMTVGQDGVVWAVVRGRLMWYDESRRRWVVVASFTHQSPVIATDPSAGIWMAVQGELHHIRLREERADGDGKSKVESQSWPLPTNDYWDRPTAMLAEENCRVWIGTLQHGVWVASWPSTTLSSTSIACGHREGSVVWHRFTVTDGLGSEWITALARGPDGHIYAAHHAGVSTFDLHQEVENGRWMTLPGSEPATGWANVLAFDPPHLGGGVWVGYHHSGPVILRHRQNGRWVDFYGDDLYPGWGLESVGAIWVEGDGSLWVGSTHGLWHGTRTEAKAETIAGKSSVYQWDRIEDEIVVHNVWTLLRDTQGRIWVGGEEGLAMWGEARPGRELADD